MTWNDPTLLFWLFALIPLLLITGLLLRRRRALLARMASHGLWPTLLPHYSPIRQHVRNVLRILALLLALLALARPQWGTHSEKVQQRGLSISVALDTSKSMLAEDIEPNRLQQAKWGVRDLVQELKGDRIGLVAFAGSAFLQCPLTSDYSAFMMMLDDTYAGIIPVGGTDLYEALDSAIQSFKDAEESDADNVIILISDGEGHTGDPLALLPKLKENNIRVFTIGVGTIEGKPILTEEGYVKDSEGNVINSALNEGMLKKIAQETGGFYVRSAPGDFGLDRIYKEGLAHLQRDEGQEHEIKVRNERFQWFLGGALLLVLIEAMVRPTKKGENA
ncbi:MAG: VWA domain-containing protein [Lentisphaerae bacterium]|jgi:Ca-activated chloride channel family protein|nr:VWA domain-containing protein [Lentisphaerota bacterium]